MLDDASGYITDKNLLPVTQLNFGRLLESVPTGRFTLGPYECSGRYQQSSAERIPTNCKDLFYLGHIHNGFYTVSDVVTPVENNINPTNLVTVVKMIYCDFEQLTFDERTTTEMKIQSIMSAEYKHLEIKLNRTESMLTQCLEASKCNIDVYNLICIA